MPLTIDVAVAKTSKFGTRDSGDTAEFVERPGGGFSVVVADGQGSGRAAKSLSLMVTSKAVGLLKEGIRDGAAARGVHDYLFAYRHGKVSATLDILSVDLAAKSILVTRNAETPMLLWHQHSFECIPSQSGPIGLYRLTKPTVRHLPLEDGMRIAVFTDGVTNAGRRTDPGAFDPMRFLSDDLTCPPTAEGLADRLLQRAVELDQGRPRDDITVVALRVHQHDERLLIRRLNAVVPLPEGTL